MVSTIIATSQLMIYSEGLVTSMKVSQNKSKI